MSINAIEVLEARFANRNNAAFREYVDARPYLLEPEYHSPEWWGMMWAKHEAWREAVYPAATQWEVTPATGRGVE